MSRGIHHGAIHQYSRFNITMSEHVFHISYKRYNYKCRTIMRLTQNTPSTAMMHDNDPSRMKHFFRHVIKLWRNFIVFSEYFGHLTLPWHVTQAGEGKKGESAETFGEYNNVSWDINKLSNTTIQESRTSTHSKTVPSVLWVYLSSNEKSAWTFFDWANAALSSFCSSVEFSLATVPPDASCVVLDDATLFELSVTSVHNNVQEINWQWQLLVAMCVIIN